MEAFQRVNIRPREDTNNREKTTPRTPPRSCIYVKKNKPVGWGGIMHALVPIKKLFC